MAARDAEAENKRQREREAENLSVSKGPGGREPRYRRLYEETPAMLFCVDSRGTIVTCNAFGASQLGYRVEELVGSELREIFHVEDQEQLRRQLERCLARPDGVEDWEVRKVRRDGSTVWVREAARMVLSARGEPTILIACEDITERKKAEALLEQARVDLEELVADQNRSLGHSKQLQKTIMENSPDYIMHVSPEGRINYINRTIAPHSPEDIQGTSIYSHLEENEAEKVRACLERARHSTSHECHVLTYRDQSGATRSFEARVSPVVLAGKVVSFVINSTDTTQSNELVDRLESAELHFERLLRDVKDVVFFTTPDGRWIDVNPAGVKLLGYSSREELLATSTIDSFRRIEDREKLASELATKGFVNDYELELKTKEGRPLVVLESSAVVKNAEGQVVGYHGIIRDVTRQRALEREVHSTLQRLEHQAFHDSLTDLPNRAALHRDFKNYLEHEASSGERIGLLLIDLDRFKDVNDALGHHVGDKLLQQVGPKLQAAVPSAKLTSYRLGGDEFAVVLTGLAVAREAMQLAQSLLAALKQPFEVNDLSLEIGASAGVSVYPELGASSNELLRGADVAMYEAKRSLSGVALYDPDSDLNTPERLAMAADLSRALQAGELVLHYQPKVLLPSGRTVGFEALLRWQHAERGLLLPGEFLPLAEVGDLIHPLTVWVVETALAQLKRWSDRHPGLTMAINLSGRNLLKRRFTQKIETLIEDSGVNPFCVEFEITETVLMTDLQVAVENLRSLAATGAKLSIDDFGTGYSSFAYLKRFAIHALKLDRSFVRDLLQNSQSRAIVTSTIQLASNLGLQMVAEGVEDPETGQELQLMGCRLAQGFQYGRARPAKDYGLADSSSTDLRVIRGIGELSAARLFAAGIKTVGAVATSDIGRLAMATRFPRVRAAAIREAAAAATVLSRADQESLRGAGQVRPEVGNT